MSKKSESYYYNNFIESISVSCEAAKMLKETLSSFNAATVPAKLNKMHQIEQRGDKKRHELTSEIVRAFITPIEREDILELSRIIDNVTDLIEDIMIRIYIHNITEIRDDAINFAVLLITCCEAVKEMLTEFPNFKKSKTLPELIIKLNRLEEGGDEIYISSMHNLHMTVKDPLLVAAWSEIYGYFEKCFDACEDVADRVECIVIGNI